MPVSSLMTNPSRPRRNLPAPRYAPGARQWPPSRPDPPSPQRSPRGCRKLTVCSAPPSVSPSYTSFLSAYIAVIDEGKAPTDTVLGKALGVTKQTVWGLVARHPDLIPVVNRIVSEANGGYQSPVAVEWECWGRPAAGNAGALSEVHYWRLRLCMANCKFVTTSWHSPCTGVTLDRISSNASTECVGLAAIR